MTFTQSQSKVDLTRLTAGLGKVWETAGMQFKIYTCRGTIHTALDAIRELRQQDPLNPEDIERITVRCGRTVMTSGWPYEPVTVTAAQMNMGYGVAVMLLERECFIEQYGESKIANPKIVDLARKVLSIHDPSIDELGPEHQFLTRIEVELKGGRHLQAEVDQPSGSPSNPVPHEDLMTKFRKLAAYVLPPDQVEQVATQVNRLETLPDVAVLAGSLAAS